MADAPLVTVGIPFHDEARWLGDAIRSVLAQTARDFELLLVDDGSTDASLEIARSFHDPRVSVFTDGQRRHLPARLNEITQRAKGTLVARMDADDVMHPERLARQLALMEEGFDAVGTWAVMVGEDDVPFATVEAAVLPVDVRTALTRGVFPHATMLAKRELLLANPYDASLTRAEDRDLFCRLVATARLGAVPETLYVVRVSPEDARFLPDYRDAHAQNRRIFRRYGPDGVGTLATARLVATSHAKVAVTRLSSRLGLLPSLVRRRGRPPTAAERERAREALAAARTAT